MLAPQSNPFRQSVDLSGLWEFRPDPQDQGQDAGWRQGFSGRPIGAPASWNDQIPELRDFLGPAWYSTRFHRPWGWEGRRVALHFASVNYLAHVWLNGVHLGHHEGGHLPFQFDITPHLQEDNLLVVRVDGRLARNRVPPGQVEDPLDSHQIGILPPATFDFFPFCGIQRPVHLVATAPVSLADLTVTTGIQGRTGLVQVQAALQGGAGGLRFTLAGQGARWVTEIPSGGSPQGELAIPEARLWSPETPHLYALTVELLDGRRVVDRYQLPVGIRTVAVEGDRLLLNGEPVVLRGFGRHEDFPVVGRGFLPPVMVKDQALLAWIGANSFRTSHYPYAEEELHLADRLGFLVIDETPAVGLFFQEEGLERRLALCRQFTRELIARDKNHPSVIAWSLANEPRSLRPAAVPFFRELYRLARSLDPTRPITIVSDLATQEESFDFFDLVCLNLYRGWYQESGRLEEGFAAFASILDETHARFGKPILVTEFGADAIPGHHALPPEMFSEEYQAALLQGYVQVMEARPFVAGQHVWNLCDFKTAQGVKRPMALNFKGVFTRDRRPKLAAHRLRALWKKGERRRTGEQG